MPYRDDARALPTPFLPMRVQYEHLHRLGLQHLVKLERSWTNLWNPEFKYGGAEDMERVEAGDALAEIARALGVYRGSATDEHWARRIVDDIRENIRNRTFHPGVW